MAKLLAIALAVTALVLTAVAAHAHAYLSAGALLVSALTILATPWVPIPRELIKLALAAAMALGIFGVFTTHRAFDSELQEQHVNAFQQFTAMESLCTPMTPRLRELQAAGIRLAGHRATATCSPRLSSCGRLNS